MQKYADLVDLENCFPTHIFLQNFVLIQPRTSPPKFANFANFANPNPNPSPVISTAPVTMCMILKPSMTWFSCTSAAQGSKGEPKAKRSTKEAKRPTRVRSSQAYQESIEICIWRVKLPPNFRRSYPERMKFQTFNLKF